ncbi:RNA polymerase sigma factor [Clostridiales bacterium COT073_COT-073]|nr:RNA polymerase sigma factor [Clostridiales bacterium COT073_COT-073]
MDSDFLLIYKIKNKDEAAGEAFVRKYYAAIFKYCSLHLRDYGQAQDITQETFLRFFEKIEHYQSYGKALNYLYVIAGNACRDFYKKKKHIYIEEMDIGTEKMECLHMAVQPLESIPLKIQIENAIDQLPSEIRETAILFFFQQLKQKEIAKILGISLSLVKYRVSRAKQILAEYLKEEAQ